MPTSIVAATCPVPACNLAPRDVESLVDSLAAYADHFLPAFQRKVLPLLMVDNSVPRLLAA